MPKSSRTRGTTAQFHADKLAGVLRLACLGWLALAGTGLPGAAAAQEVLIDGLAWRQLPVTGSAGLTWNDVASVCPLDESPCEGSVKGVDFTGWTLASYDRVQQLLDTLTGFQVPALEPFESPIELFHDRFDAVLDNSSVRLSQAFFAPDTAPGDTVDVIAIQDALSSAGSDRLDLKPVAVDATTDTASVFGQQPFAVFLVRDPDLEICSNGRDDDGDGQVDGSDSECPGGALEVDTVSTVANGGDLVMSADGSVFVYTCAPDFDDLCLYDIEAGESEVLLERQDAWWDIDEEWLSVSNGGAYVVFGGTVQEGAPDTVNIYDRAADSFEIISTAPDGSLVYAQNPTITPDGRYVVFYADDGISPDDNNDSLDVYRFDRETGALNIISLAHDGSQVGGLSEFIDHAPRISDDGSRIVFSSRALLVPDDTNSAPDLFLVDGAAGNIERVNLTSDGQESEHADVAQYSISGDGNVVAWTDSDGRDLVTTETNGEDAVYARDLAAASTRLVYRTAGGGFPNEPVRTNDSMPISADGGTGLYITDATNIVADDTNGDVHDIFVYDRASGSPAIVSLDESGEQFPTSGIGFSFDMSADASRVVYEYQSLIHVANLARQAVPTPEACDNTFDDDGDGLIDDEDLEDCPRPIVGLRVRCSHDPVYVAETGEVVTIRAEATDRAGDTVVADTVSISLGPDWSEPEEIVAAGSRATVEFPPTGTFSYACQATSGVEQAFSGRRTVAVEGFDDDFPALPVLYNGPLDEKIDIVFFPDEDEYTSPTDPNFIADVGLLISGGYFTVPWFMDHQDRFNFWIGLDTANSGPNPDDIDDNGNAMCFREAPDRYRRTYAFADSSGIVHRSVCRDNAGSPGIFTIEMDLNRLQVVAHESGHRPFGLADEYCCDGGYYTRQLFGPPYPNMFKLEAGCRNKGEARGQDPDACRSIVDVDTGNDWWLFEPDYDDIDPEPSDLMQQQGCVSLDSRAACRPLEPDKTGPDDDPNGVVACSYPLETYVGDPDGTPDYWACRRTGSASEAVWVRWRVGSRYDLGPSERDRMQWFLSECRAGRC
ncbi:MAG: hypothetical protein U5K76_15950 [Woeseiaceae bacterium]|nr:hypothetical protein [Woeseiaceae bacterium]